MKLNNIIHQSHEILLYLPQPFLITISRTVDIKLYLYNSKYTRICNYINREYINIGYAFYRAAIEGRLEVCKWLYKFFGLTKKDATEDDNQAFTFAARDGHLEVCKWIHSVFNLTKKNVISKHSYAFDWAVCCGHLEVCKWLMNTFNLTREDINTHILMPESEEMKKWLRDTFGVIY